LTSSWAQVSTHQISPRPNGAAPYPNLPLIAPQVLSFAARNLTEEEKKGHKELKWDDPDVCGPYMVRFCPHDLFVNTKSNIGTAIPSFLFLMRFAVIFFTHDKFGWGVCRAVLEDPRSEAQGKVISVNLN
jgi:hypothetical protein